MLHQNLHKKRPNKQKSRTLFIATFYDFIKPNQNRYIKPNFTIG